MDASIRKRGVAEGQCGVGRSGANPIATRLK